MILLLEELLKFSILGVVLLDSTCGLVLGQKFVALDRSALEDDIDSIRFELIDKRLELPEKIVYNRRWSGLESGSSTMTLVHEIDTKD